MINHFQWETAQTMRKNTEYFDPSLTLRRFMMVNLYRTVGLVF